VTPPGDPRGAILGGGPREGAVRCNRPGRNLGTADLSGEGRGIPASASSAEDDSPTTAIAATRGGIL
jgi:hypothetical protein